MVMAWELNLLHHLPGQGFQSPQNLLEHPLLMLLLLPLLLVPTKMKRSRHQLPELRSPRKMGHRQKRSLEPHRQMELYSMGLDSG